MSAESTGLLNNKHQSEELRGTIPFFTWHYRNETTFDRVCRKIKEILCSCFFGSNPVPPVVIEKNPNGESRIMSVNVSRLFVNPGIMDSIFVALDNGKHAKYSMNNVYGLLIDKTKETK